MNKEEQFEILKTTIKNFLIDNKHFNTKEEAEKYVEEELHGDINALVEDDKEDFGLNLLSLDNGY